MEDKLTLDELYLLRSAAQKVQHRAFKFMAALKGIDLDEEQNQSSFEEVQRRAAAELAGISEEEYVFNEIGIDIEHDDD